MSNNTELAKLKKQTSLVVTIAGALSVIAFSLVFYFKPETTSEILNLLVIANAGFFLPNNKKGLVVHISFVLIVITLILFLNDIFSRISVICLVIVFCNVILGLVNFYISEKIEVLGDEVEA